MMTALGNFLFRYRNFVFPLALPLALIPGPRIFASTMAAATIGLLIALMGQTVRALTIGLVYIIRGGRNRRVYAEDLVTEGIYAHSRNPMYVGNMLLVTGVALTANSWGCLAVVVPLFALFYLAIVQAEEVYLRSQFGAAYGQYEAAVPRFMPRFAGLRETVRSSQFHWRRLFSKEYGTLAGWPLRWMIVLVYALWRDDELDKYPALFPVLTGAVAALTMAYVVVRTLKKRRLIHSD